jgi:hypothetical protein
VGSGVGDEANSSHIEGEAAALSGSGLVVWSAHLFVRGWRWVFGWRIQALPEPPCGHRPASLRKLQEGLCGWIERVECGDELYHAFACTSSV